MIFVVLLASLGWHAPGINAAPAGCGRATLTSGGDVCTSLSVQFDLSDCDDAKKSGAGIVSCRRETGVAEVKTAQAIYSVVLKKAEHGGWEIVGPVTRKFWAEMKAAPAVFANAPATLPVPAGAPDGAGALGSAPAATKVKSSPIEPASPPESPGLKVGGALDAYYAYNFNQPTTVTPPTTANPGLPTAQTPLRGFDAYHNQVALSLAELTLRYSGREVGFKLDLDFGQTTDIEHRAANGATDAVSKHVGQAVVYYSPAAIPNFTLGVGKMPSHLGLESMKAQENWQYSRSFLYMLAIPHWHVGATLAFGLVPGKLNLGLGIYNGWNQLYDFNDAKTLGLQLSFTPVRTLALSYNLIWGAEQAGNNGDRRLVQELNAVWTASDKVSLAFDFVYGTSANETLASGSVANVSWLGGTIAAKFNLHPKYYLSPRLELFRDGEGFATGAASAQTLDGITLTNGYRLAEGFETRLEFRRDHATLASFLSRNGAGVDSQVTASMSFLFSF
ncbi:MAG: outer membrane beta-barrel protein [Bacteriovoracia bacterium]